MPIYFDDVWLPAVDGHTRVKQVYRGREDVIGRVRRWQAAELGEPMREWFTAERWAKGLYVPIEGTHPDFEEALQRIIFYGVAH
ncbi:hypothetical protein [Methylobacterium nodulans]|uniref:Uncharacterized protein n=1 Tax=Methylobacterium nodulans (strain LMG 21967 / CNCM I-2342 / ORS 2060) TaxID=460265 RepID=B8IIJ9_METNO|nr:hypothetical protein [Methylobacterium nodulans]ACL58827.1 conserved hypothetical protein [Methylobacterium nodulans ORS 2060]ACL59876.1 conserved hypothetical protein [Methylobacterium nodulans ORS 2060]